MARDLFIDTTNRRLAVSTTNLAPATTQRFVRGDTGAFNLYFLEATGVINNPFKVIDKTSSTVKFAIGSRTATPTNGTYTLSFSAETTGAINYSATSGTIQQSLNLLSSISSAGGVSVSGSLETTFVVRFNNNGAQTAITANVEQLIPKTSAFIEERVAGSSTQKEIQELQFKVDPAVFENTWSDIGTIITATLTTIITGGVSANEVQRLSFSRNPSSGTFRLTVPTYNVLIASTITNGVFISSENHGLAISQPVILSGFTALTGYTNGSQYVVKTIPQSNQFTLAITSGASVITGSGEPDESGYAATILRQTNPIDHNASPSDVQNLLQVLDSIGSGNVIVNGAQGSYYDFTFINYKGFTDLPVLNGINNLVGASAKIASVDFTSSSLRDLLGNNQQTTLDLEIELTDADGISTMILTPCIVQEQLIY